MASGSGRPRPSPRWGGSVAAMALLWVSVVAASATLTWFVVAQAGLDVGRMTDAQAAALSHAVPGRPAPIPSPAAGARPSPTAPQAAATATSQPARTTSHQPPQPSAVPSQPSLGRQWLATGPPTAPAAPAAPPAPASSALPSARAFGVVGGVVTAHCAGTTPVARSIAPRDGYGFERGVEGDVLTVTFTAGGGAPEVRIGCRAGEPVGLAQDE